MLMPIFKISTVTKWYGSHVHFWGEHQNMNLETWNFTVKPPFKVSLWHRGSEHQVEEI